MADVAAGLARGHYYLLLSFPLSVIEARLEAKDGSVLDNEIISLVCWRDSGTVFVLMIKEGNLAGTDVCPSFSSSL